MILFIAAVLVLFMQSGFALVETGLNASKNAVNIMFKNFMDMAVGTLLFFVVGYGIMYPGADDKAHIIPNVLGFAQVGIADADPTPVQPHCTRRPTSCSRPLSVPPQPRSSRELSLVVSSSPPT